MYQLRHYKELFNLNTLLIIKSILVTAISGKIRN